MSSNEFDKDKNFHILHEKYQAESTELPPGSIDENILQAAHRAVEVQGGVEKSQPSGVFHRVKKHPWYHPMSYVAIIVISLSVVMKLAFEPGFVESEFNGDDFSDKAQMQEAEEVAIKPQNRISQEQKKIAKAVAPKATKTQQQTTASWFKAKEKKPMLMKPKAASAPDVSASQQREQKIESAVSGAAMSKFAEPMRAMSQTGPEVAADIFLDESEPSVLARQKISQKNQIHKLMKLLESRQFEKLKLALQQYRKDYPLKNGVDNELPQVLSDLETKWQTENTAKSLNND